MRSEVRAAPVSAALRAEVSSSVQKHGLVVWLDAESRYDAFVDALLVDDGPPFSVVAFRGSFLETMLALEPLTAGTDPPRVLVHLPGFNNDTVRVTPLYDLFAAGTRFEKALPTLVTEAAAGLVQAELVDGFLAQGDVTLEAADGWLASQLADETGGIASELQRAGFPGFISRLLERGAGRYVATEETRAALADFLSRRLGIASSWWEDLGKSGEGAGDYAFVASSWVLAVEYVHDLTHPPYDERLAPLKALPKATVERCQALAQYLREHHAEHYQQSADNTEELLVIDQQSARAEDLGQVDTFKFEEQRIFDGTIAALESGQYAMAHEWAQLRAAGGSFWLQGEPNRIAAWSLLLHAAELGVALDGASEAPTNATVAEVVDAYVARGVAVDGAHRRLEQRRLVLHPHLPAYHRIRACLNEMRSRWRSWADQWADAFNAACRTHGFVAESALQQRRLFDDVVMPQVEAGTVAYFVVDALRFEMAEELRRSIGDEARSMITLRPRLAELPTVTEVGMNALAPVHDGGALHPEVKGGSLKGFQQGAFRVFDPKTRQKAMHQRVGGTQCPWMKLGDVLARDEKKLKETVSKARLLVVHSLEIDNAGEKGLGPSAFDHALQDLKAAWRLLRDAGVQRFVITSDHGFLLLHGGGQQPIKHGNKKTPNRRYVLSAAEADHPGELRVSFKELGYQGDNLQLMMPETTAPFDIGQRDTSFVHGGNSLQERVIPVLTLEHEGMRGGDGLTYRIQAKAGDGLLGMHCIELTVMPTGPQAGLFGGAESVELGLRPQDPARSLVVVPCQTRPEGHLHGSVIHAPVGKEIELFFRVQGPEQGRQQVELHHTGAAVDVEPCTVAGRFAVEVLGLAASEQTGEAEGPASDKMAWLSEFDDEGVRDVFRHLAEHGNLTESEAAKMVGGPRALRRFSRNFETYRQRLPFNARIETVAGVKRYVREGER